MPPGQRARDRRRRPRRPRRHRPPRPRLPQLPAAELDARRPASPNGQPGQRRRRHRRRHVRPRRRLRAAPRRHPQLPHPRPQPRGPRRPLGDLRPHGDPALAEAAPRPGLRHGLAQLPGLVHRAQFGDAAWEELFRIPRPMWMDYLRWYRRVLELPVENGVDVRAIAPDADGLLAPRHQRRRRDPRPQRRPGHRPRRPRRRRHPRLRRRPAAAPLGAFLRRRSTSPR